MCMRKYSWNNYRISRLHGRRLQIPIVAEKYTTKNNSRRSYLSSEIRKKDAINVKKLLKCCSSNFSSSQTINCCKNIRCKKEQFLRIILYRRGIAFNSSTLLQIVLKINPSIIIHVVLCFENMCFAFL